MLLCVLLGVVDYRFEATIAARIFGWITIMIAAVGLALGRSWLKFKSVDVQMEPIPESVPLGDDLIVRLKVDGRPVDSALVRYRVAGSSERNETDMEPRDGALLIDKFSGVISDCRSDLEVQVVAGPFDSGRHSGIVRIPLVLESGLRQSSRQRTSSIRKLSPTTRTR